MFFFCFKALGPNQPPLVFNCPNDITTTLPAGQQSAIISWTEPTATDDSGLVPTRTSTHNPQTSFNVGTTLVTYTFIDNLGLTSTCTFNVIITGKI